MTINCKGILIDLSTPKIMGILNLTPDSFFDGGRYRSDQAILDQVQKMLADGATFIDLGAYSTRPGAPYVTEDEELTRILPVVEGISKAFPSVLISIDTFRSNVAKRCIEAGAAMINDVSAGKLDENMFATIAALGVPFVMMHMKGDPGTMQQHTQYTDLHQEMLFYFSERVAKARALGICDLIIDPGFGFAKTMPQNYQILKNLELLGILNLPILVGLSRKSMIYNTLGTNAENALNGTTALNMVALGKGASILRVHDVKEAQQCVQLAEALNT